MKSLFAAIFASAVFVLHAADGDVIATSGEVEFFYNSLEESPFGLVSADSFFAPVTWRMSETVTVTAPDGTTTTMAENASEEGTSTFTPTLGGVWKLSNSVSGTVKVCVPWSIYNDGESATVTSAAAVFAADTVESGPNRNTKKREHLPIAYSGDDWIGDLAKASSLTFTPPADSGIEEWTLDMVNGQGAQPVELKVSGDWIVTLTFADGKTRTATIGVQAPGLVIKFK